MHKVIVFLCSILLVVQATVSGMNRQRCSTWPHGYKASYDSLLGPDTEVVYEISHNIMVISNEDCLREAINNNDITLVEKLLSFDVNPNSIIDDNDFATPLTYVLSTGKKAEEVIPLLKILLDYKADPSISNKYHSPLHLALDYGSECVEEVLGENLAAEQKIKRYCEHNEIKYIDHNGLVGLAEKRRRETNSKLVNIQNQRGMTPLVCVQDDNSPETLKIINFLKKYVK